MLLRGPLGGLLRGFGPPLEPATVITVVVLSALGIYLAGPEAGEGGSPLRFVEGCWYAAESIGVVVAE